MKIKFDDNKKTKGQKIIFGMIVLIILAIPIGIIFASNVTYDRKVEEETNSANFIKATLLTEQIANLVESSSVLSNKYYVRTKTQLERLFEVDDSLANIYIYTEEKNRLKYIVSTAKNSMPNDIFKDASEGYFEPFESKDTVVVKELNVGENKVRSILAPVMSDSTVIAVIRVDYFRKNWLLSNYRVVGMVMLSLGLMISLLIYIYLNMKKDKQIKLSQKTYKLLLDEMQQGLALHEIILDKNNKAVDYRFIGVNPAFENIMGMSENEIIGKSVLEILPKTESYWINEYAKVALHDKHLRYENYSADLDKYFEVLAYSPQKGQFATIVTDITHRKIFERKLYEEKTFLETTLIAVGDGVISTDKVGNVIILNKEAEILTGWTQKQAVGISLSKVFDTINEITKRKCYKQMKEVYEENKTFELHDNTILRSKEGIDTPIEGIISAIKDSDGNNNGAVLVFRDYSDKRKKQSEIEYLSFHDKLTGLYNRRFLDEEMMRIDTKRNYPISVVMADLNGLKLVNDSFGHAAGDKLLVDFTSIVKNECRADDIISRVGGDEFVFLLPNTEQEETKRFIERIKIKLADAKVCNIQISSAFGYAIKRGETAVFENVVKNAESLMYKNKLNESVQGKKKAIDIVLKTLHESYPREKAHSENVRKLCGEFGRALRFTDSEISELELFGFMHNIGKININKDILTQQKDLDEEESLEIKRHADIGYQILRSVNEYSIISNYVLQHHERYDGTGYPRGLKKEEIAIQPRMLAIVEAYDRMVHTNYRKPLDKQAAIDQLYYNKGKQFDPHLVDVFVDQVL